MPLRGRAAKLKMVNGRLVSSRSRTGDPVCSEAMSAWQNIRRGNPASMALDAAMKILGQCRAKARALKQAAGNRSDGNEAKAQALESRVNRGGPITAKDRLAKARELRAQRSARVSPDSPQAAQRLAEIRAKNAAGKAEAKPLHAQALEAARRVPAEKRVGEKVFVHHAWQEYRKGGGKLGLNEFKSGLANDLEGRRLMSRADLVQGMRPGDVKGSNVPYLGTNFNFIRTGQGGLGFGSKIQPREMVSRQRKDGKWITPVNEAERSKAAGLVAKLRAQRQPAPSLREQAAKHRASKGTEYYSRVERILKKAEDIESRTAGASRLAAQNRKQAEKGAKVAAISRAKEIELKKASRAASARRHVKRIYELMRQQAPR